MAITLCGPWLSSRFTGASGLVTLLTRSCNPAVQARRFRLFRFRSPLLSESLLIYFPPGTEMVHFPGLARTRLCIQRAVYRFYRHGFPHSEIPGSKPACGSPRLIAASHVLHRLLAPRHPPYALSSLTIKLTRHVAPALACRGSLTVRIIRLSTIRSLEQNLRSTRVAIRAKIGANRFACFASFFSCQRASALGASQSVPRPAERSKISNRNKNPASSRRANPPAKLGKRLRAMLD